ncbi:MAG: Arginine transport system permease protein ArtQ [Candidatus Izimaplasma bacterium HR2]|nr:MAG: Arginine transport system permease protein ArtQ [Candidatus Izimaplasma bacterium HR2]
MSDLFNYDSISPWIPYLSKGLGYTLLIALLASILGVAIGVMLTLMSRHKQLSKISYFYIDIFRGTPILLQLSIIYFAIPKLVDTLVNDMMHLDIAITLSAFSAAIITFSLNSGAYISEIIRSGINSVSKGEIEAAEALGVSKYHMYKDIILPIAFKNSFPALMNEFITLVKESSIVSIIGLQDLMRRQQIVTSQTYMYFEPLIVVGIIYYLVIKVLTITGRKVEKRLQYD